MSPKSESMLKLKHCQLCNRQETQAKYKCPRCAVAYCSIPCYKSDAHASCVEHFQANSLKPSLQGRKADACSSRQVESILTSMQQSQNNDSDEPDIASRFQGLSLDSASPEEILARLTPAERKTFEDIVSHGELPSALIDVIPLWTPWWLAAPKPTIIDLSDPPTLSTPSTDSPLPPLPESLPPLPPAHPINSLLALNLPDLLLAYATTLRYMDGDLFADAFASATILWDLSTILGAGPELATYTFPDIDSFVDHAVDTALKFPTYFMAVTRLPILLRDVVALLSTPVYLMRALHELGRLFDEVATTAKAQLAVAMTPASHAAVKKHRRRAYLTGKKCEYYLMFAAWIETSGDELRVDREQAMRLIKAVVARLQAEVEGREVEEEQVSGLSEVFGARRELLASSSRSKGKKVLIVETTS